MAEIKWIKLKTGMFNDDKIKVIQAMPEGDALIVIWIRMLVLAGISNAEGYLMISDNLPYTEEMLSTIFNKPLSVIRLAVKTFETFGMIEANNEGIYIQNFTENQSDKMQDIREYNRIKKQESREKARLSRFDKSIQYQVQVIDTSLTSQGKMSTFQSLDIDKEKDIERDKDIKNNTPQNQTDLAGKPERVDFEKITILYNSTCKDLPKVRGVLSDERKRKVKTLLNALDKSKVLLELGAYERMEYIFRLADESDFLSGRIQPNKWCGFDWLVNSTNAIKVIEGNYKNSGNGGAGRYGSSAYGNGYGNSEDMPKHSSEAEDDALAAFRSARK
jgi:predicted phage replisome organizer